MVKGFYDGGNNGWGHLIYECPYCGQREEWDCDEDGIPTILLTESLDGHECEEDED